MGHHHTDAEWHFGRRGGSGHGKGGRGPFGSNFGRGAGFFRAGKMIADGDLKLIVLSLISDRPRHGYDIIKALEDMSSGIYSPSPGVVYPTLSYLEDMGFAVSTSEGNKRVFSMTDAGRAHLEANRELVDSVMSSIEAFGRKFAGAREWFNRTAERATAGRGDRDIDGVLPEVNAARRDLKAAIAEKIGSADGIQRRMADILSDAAKAIRDLSDSPDDAIDL